MGKPQLIAVGMNSIQRALDHSAPSNTTPLGANLKLIERARSNRGNTVCKTTAWKKHKRLAVSATTEVASSK